MEHSAQGKRSDTLGPTCWSSRALKGRVFKIGFKKLTQILSKNTLNVLSINEIVFAF